MRIVWRILFLAVLLAGLSGIPAGRAAAVPPARSYLVVSASDSTLPPGLDTSIAAAGGTITRLIPQIGVAAVSSADPNFKTKAAKITGVTAVIPNPTLEWIDPSEQTVKGEIANPPNSGAPDPLFNLQWGHAAIQAPAAWQTGAYGAGVRVAVLDSGIEKNHPDLAPNLNTELSKSFIEGEEYYYTGVPGDFNHGTHVSGIIAAAVNGSGVIGVAPKAELVMVKVLSEKTTTGSYDAIDAGLVYAADIGADVINMSIGGWMPRRGFLDKTGVWVSAADVAAIINIDNRAASYATKKGALIVASAGNQHVDFDHSPDWFETPAQSINVLAVSATSPRGWGFDTSTNLDVPTSYTNYGASAIHFAAPGGQWVDFGNQLCTVGGITWYCSVLDAVLSDGTCDETGCYLYWATGTSMAAPYVSGVAALIIGQHGGSMDPAQVKAILKASADDLGKPGKDPWFGSGRVNAYNAVK